MNHPRRMKLGFETRGEVLEAIAAAPENDRRQIVRQAVATANSASRIEKIAEISQGNVALNKPDRFPVIYADPPWRYEHTKTDNRAIENHYPTMDLDDIWVVSQK